MPTTSWTMICNRPLSLRCRNILTPVLFLWEGFDVSVQCPIPIISQEKGEPLIRLEYRFTPFISQVVGMFRNTEPSKTFAETGKCHSSLPTNRTLPCVLVEQMHGQCRDCAEKWWVESCKTGGRVRWEWIHLRQPYLLVSRHINVNGKNIFFLFESMFLALVISDFLQILTEHYLHHIFISTM